MNLRVAFKIHPILAALCIAGILLLAFSTFRGCKQSKLEVAAKEKIQKIADSALDALRDYKHDSDSTNNDFAIRNELLEGQNSLLENKLERSGNDLDKAIAENKELIAQHKLARYVDTSATLVPADYVKDCEQCFVNLETTTNLSLRYKSDLNTLQNNWDKQNQLHQSRFKQLESEKLGLYNKMQGLAVQAKEATDKLKPHGSLYLSWGVLWSPWPIAAGAGLMYQTRYRFQYGFKYYYSNKGGIVETSMHFPLSIKF